MPGFGDNTQNKLLHELTSELLERDSSLWTSQETDQTVTPKLLAKLVAAIDCDQTQQILEILRDKNGFILVSNPESSFVEIIKLIQHKLSGRQEIDPPVP